MHKDNTRYSMLNIKTKRISEKNAKVNWHVIQPKEPTKPITFDNIVQGGISEYSFSHIISKLGSWASQGSTHRPRNDKKAIMSGVGVTKSKAVFGDNSRQINKPKKENKQ